MNSEWATVAAALIAALGAVLAALIALRNHHALTEIHVLVNSNLDHVKTQLALALVEIARLENHIAEHLPALPPP